MHALRASNDKSNQSMFVDKKLISNKFDNNLASRFKNHSNTSMDAALFSFEPKSQSAGPQANLFSQDFLIDDPKDNIIPKKDPFIR